MSDSEEDFHSADEGDIDDSSAENALSDDKKEESIAGKKTEKRSKEGETADDVFEDTDTQDDVGGQEIDITGRQLIHDRHYNGEIQKCQDVKELKQDVCDIKPSKDTLTESLEIEGGNECEGMVSHPVSDVQSESSISTTDEGHGNSTLDVASITEDTDSTDISISSGDVKKDTEAATEDNDWNDDNWGWESSLESAVESATSVMSSVLHKFEHSLGIPDPRHMAEVVTAEEHKAEKDANPEDVKESEEEDLATDARAAKSDASAGGSWFGTGWGSWGVSGITNIVQSASKDLVSGSLDTLEYLGKKTMNVISDGDPGLRTKRDALVRPFAPKTVSLSEALQEARNSYSESREASNAQDKVTFRDRLEEGQGYAHLEALEMLSNESERKLQRILKVQSDEALEETKNLLISIKLNFEAQESLDDPELDRDIPDKLRRIAQELGLSLSLTKLVNSFENGIELLETGELDGTCDEFYDRLMASLAEVTCRCLELVHKVAELFLVPNFQSDTPVVAKASNVRDMLSLLVPTITALSSAFATKLNDIGKEIETEFCLSESVTELHYEGSNCASYLEDCHRLLLPIIQLAAVK